MVKIGIYYAYWIKDWLADLPFYIKKARELGYDVLEVSPACMIDMSKKELNEIKKAASDNCIDITYCIGLSKEYDITSKNKAVREKGIEYLKRTIEMISYMGGKLFGGVNFGPWCCLMEDGEDDKRPYYENSVNSVRQVAKTAEDYNIIYAVEVINRFEQFLFNSVDEAIAYVDAVGSPNVKIHLDTFHMNIEEDNIEEAILRAGDKLGHFHFSENNRKLPGKGHIDWDGVINALKKINYDKNIIIESFVKAGGKVGRDLRIWRDLCQEDLDNEAKKALVFLREKL